MVSAEVTEPERPSFALRMFGSHEFFRLWLTQVSSATGDWLGFLAIAALATRIGAGSPAAAVGVVMAARIVPGFFLGAASGVIADRFDRKRVMVVCDIGRAGVLVFLPFVDSIFGLVVASLVLEVFTLLWTPAKEASVPNLVPPDHLTTANSLSMAAAYGTVPVAAGIFALLSKISEGLGDSGIAHTLRIDDQGLAFYVDALTFLFSALVIARLPLPKRERPKTERTSGKRIDWGQAFFELKEGWQFIFVNPVVRAVNVGLATGLIGGGMLVPLGPVFSNDVLGSGDDGFGFFIFALGIGVAIGVVLLSIFQKRLPKPEVFAGSVFVAGISLLVAASMSTLLPAAFFVMILGICAGSVYVLGFTLLHESVDDDLRGRIFGALYILIRFCVLLAFAVGPLLADLLDRISNSLVDRELSLLGVEVAIPGVRLTLWLAGLIIMSAGVLAVRSLRSREERDGRERWLGAEIVAGFTNPINEVKRSHDHPSLRDDEPS
ncbi:MAG: MFS transporter [Actinomycetota bacterium]|nr:MFS transporter [Actinomycetota bacterium]